MPYSNGGLNGLDSSEFGRNAALYLVVNFFIWVSSSSMHILMTPRLLCHIKAHEEAPEPPVRTCNIPKEGLNDE